MGRVVRVRLVLAAIGAVVFFFGIRAQSNRARWVGIAFVGAAWIGRFYRPRRSTERQGPSM